MWYKTAQQTSIKIKNTETTPHVVIKFFDQYRNLSNDLAKEGVGENLKIHIDAKFPPNQKSSVLGIAMSEEALQQRFVDYHDKSTWHDQLLQMLFVEQVDGHSILHVLPVSSSCTGEVIAHLPPCDITSVLRK